MPFSGGSIANDPINLSAANNADSGVCSISPSDLVGYVGNALNRIKELEQKVTELQAANVSAGNIGQISGQIGWVGGITYMGIPGWTQTVYGSLIPPPGVSLSSLGIFPPFIPGGNNMQFVIYDEDGNLVFGADEIGQLFGSQIGGNVAFLYTDTIHAQAVGSFSESAITINTGYDPGNLVTVDGISFNVVTSGIYRLGLHCSINGWGTQTASAVYLQWNVPDNSNSYNINDTVGPIIYNQVGDNGNFQTNITHNASRTMYINSGSTMSLTSAGVGSSTTFLVNAAELTLQLLKAV